MPPSRLEPEEDGAENRWLSRPFGVREIRILGFRSARALAFAPGPLCALVGEASVGKSNVLTAIWRLLNPGAGRRGRDGRRTRRHPA